MKLRLGQKKEVTLQKFIKTGMNLRRVQKNILSEKEVVELH